MTQIRVLFVAFALTLTTLAGARPAEACGGGYVPLTDEERVTTVIRAQVSWLKQGEIDSVVRAWIEVNRAEVERWSREFPKDAVITAIEVEITGDGEARVMMSLQAGDRHWVEAWWLRKKDGAWKVVTGWAPGSPKLRP